MILLNPCASDPNARLTCSEEAGKEGFFETMTPMSNQLKVDSCPSTNTISNYTVLVVQCYLVGWFVLWVVSFLFFFCDWLFFSVLVDFWYHCGSGVLLLFWLRLKGKRNTGLGGKPQGELCLALGAEQGW